MKTLSPGGTESNRHWFQNVLAADATLWALVAFEVAVLVAARVVGTSDRSPIVTAALVVAVIAAVGVVAGRSLIRHKLMLGGVIGAGLLLAT
jgi:hypothetical protein